MPYHVSSGEQARQEKGILSDSLKREEHKETIASSNVDQQDMGITNQFNIWSNCIIPTILMIAGIGLDIYHKGQTEYHIVMIMWCGIAAMGYIVGLVRGGPGKRAKVQKRYSFKINSTVIGGVLILLSLAIVSYVIIQGDSVRIFVVGIWIGIVGLEMLGYSSVPRNRRNMFLLNELLLDACLAAAMLKPEIRHIALKGALLFFCITAGIKTARKVHE